MVECLTRKSSHSLIELKGEKFIIYNRCEIRLSICLKWFMQLTLGCKGSTFRTNYNYMFEASYLEPLDDSTPL